MKVREQDLGVALPRGGSPFGLWSERPICSVDSGSSGASSILAGNVTMPPTPSHFSPRMFVSDEYRHVAVT